MPAAHGLPPNNPRNLAADRMAKQNCRSIQTHPACGGPEIELVASRVARMAIVGWGEEKLQVVAIHIVAPFVSPVMETKGPLRDLKN
ncbi:MAG: hypothetical protein ACQESR_24330, partial [Planctomycetota bacterium]